MKQEKAHRRQKRKEYVYTVRQTSHSACLTCYKQMNRIDVERIFPKKRSGMSALLYLFCPDCPIHNAGTLAAMLADKAGAARYDQDAIEAVYPGFIEKLAMSLILEGV
jgi:hypothetical protein